MSYDVIIAGGSYAGIAAALQLARARRSVLVIDAGLRRNRFAVASHGFLGQDGRPPGVIANEARQQLLTYPTVTWIAGTAVTAGKTEHEFIVDTEDGERYHSKRLILATGVIDELPGIPGLRERWGVHVFHCPYCHGYELHNGRIGVLAVGPASLHHAMLLPDWGSTTLFTNNAVTIDALHAAQLAARGVTIEQEAVAGITGEHANVLLESGRVVACDGLFIVPHTVPASLLATQLGCAMEHGDHGSFVRVDPIQKTTTPGVFACGDAARAFGSISLAVGDGARAGGAAHQSLIFGD